MAYIASSNIISFPTVKRTDYASTSRLLSEENLTNAIRALSGGSGSFVITQTFNASNPFEFCIHGYYFKISTGSLITSAVTSGDIYAHITVSTASGFTEITGQDVSSAYQGLLLDSSSSGGTYTLKLLDNNNGVYSIPSESRISTDIDCGEV